MSIADFLFAAFFGLSLLMGGLVMWLASEYR